MAKKKEKKTKASSSKLAEAKAAKKAGKAKKSKKAAKADPELNQADMAQRIWLAGIGAYGKAYDKALANSKSFTKQSTELFEELVKRGEEIEQDLKARVQSSDAGKKSRKLAAKLEKLEGEFAETVSRARSESKARGEDVKVRIQRLREEIESVATETSSEIVTSGLNAARRTTKAVQDAVSGAGDSVSNGSDSSRKQAGPAAASVDDFTLMTGVGPALSAKLKAAGISSFAEIAALNKAGIEALDAQIMARGRIVRDEWVKQAKRLMK